MACEKDWRTAMTNKLVASAFGALVLLAAVSLPTAAQAGDNWMPREQAITQLEDAKREVRQGLGLARGGQAVLELFVGPTGDWSLLVTQVNGLSCVTGAGEAWTLDKPLEGDPI